jgi:hypothetical protein
MSKIFFYGLFMDSGMLTGKGFHPELLEEGKALEALCYNLPLELVAGANPAYAIKLATLVEALKFDSEYVAEIAAFGEAA